ncbi:MAG: hypothetical protein SLRJCFUN_000317, partial [Candidatus Fervidibacter sp.]
VGESRLKKPTSVGFVAVARQFIGGQISGGRTSGEPNVARPADLPISRPANPFGLAGASPSPKALSDHPQRGVGEGMP